MTKHPPPHDEATAAGLKPSDTGSEDEKNPTDEAAKVIAAARAWLVAIGYRRPESGR